MKNPLEIYQETQNIRKQTLLEVAGMFLDRGTLMTLFKAKSFDVLLDQTNDLAAIEKTVTENTFANIGVTIGKENNLIALKLERESPHDEDPFELLSVLEGEYGLLPSTITIQYPNKTSYRLYEYPDVDIKLTTLGQGVKVIKSNAFGAGVVLLNPSELDDGAVCELSHSIRIAKLPDRWVGFIGSDPYAEYSYDVAKPEVTPGNVDVKGVESDVMAETKPDVVKVTNPVVVPVDCKVDGSSENQHHVPAEDYLQLAIAKMVIDDRLPGETLAKALVVREKYGLSLKIKELFLMVYTEYSKTERYVGAGSENEKLMRFVTDVELDCFRDHHKELCCKIKPTGEVIVLSSKAGSKISSYLAYRMIQLTNSSPKDIEVKNVLKFIEIMAQFEGDEVRMFNRVGKYEGDIHYDLGDQHAVKVVSGSWQIVDAPPIFRRYPNCKVNVIPQSGGRVERFFEFVNHESKDRLLLSVYMIAAFVPEIAHPLLYVYGSHGGAKTSMASKVKTVIDPSTLNALIMNSKREEVIRNLKQYYVSSYDNVSYISSELSDVFCTASTGAGMDNRKKYTDEESHIMSFKHCVILNGMKLAIRKPDLLDRSILIKLKRVKAKDEQEIDAGFNAALPEILGGVFDALAKALTILPSVEVESFRMASFAKWGYAIAEALGGHGERFLLDYRANISEQNDLVAQSNSLAHAVLSLMENRDRLKLTIGKAYDELKKLVRVSNKDRTFPGRDKELRPYLEELGPVLDTFGIRFEFGKLRSNVGWTVTFINDSVDDSEVNQEQS